RRRSREPLARYERGLPQVAYAVGDTRVLARLSLRHLRAGRDAPPELTEALDSLASAVWELAGAYDDDRRPHAVRDAALGAATRLEAAVETARDVRLAELVAQVRSVAVDLVRAADLAGGPYEADAERPTEELLASAR
ncbi:MAG: hypothetical protein QOE28_576, partial [Solirubrobacteraceae bacterium]|nr:hypothetical protein [Solirubrobacteraceae bacterium]